ncbi:uncharacterized protein V1510DRAFT_410133 [Dipodascopsis tothii]|uniref:uncharacterized protein n=1 Tax=Dipodascopsis tothii TaxID=44089 RepID=UPI0034CD909F
MPSAEHYQRALAAFAAGDRGAELVHGRLDGDGPLIVLDSSFNPPTAAHAELARLACARETAPRLLLLLAVRNADKGDVPAPLAERLAMMELLAAELADAGTAAAVAVGLTRHARFVDKAAGVAELAAGEQVYLVGYDTAVRLLDAKYYDRPVAAALAGFMAQARLAVVVRDGADWPPAAEQRALAADVAAGRTAAPPAWAARLAVIEPGAATGAVSSSAARRALATAAAADAAATAAATAGLLHPAVALYAAQRGLYRS